MKDVNELKIEFKYGWEYPNHDYPYKEVFYRIVPEELTWFDRIFLNPWTPVEHCASEMAVSCFKPYEMTNYFPSVDFVKQVKQNKTVREIEKYMEDEREKSKHFYKLMTTNGTFWPEDPNE